MSGIASPISSGQTAKASGNGVDDLGLDAENMIPRTQSAFRVDQVAKMFWVSSAHVFNLIKQGEIVVPQERIDSAPSRASILIPRDSLVDFVRRRSSPTWLAVGKAARAKARGGKKGK